MPSQGRFVIGSLGQRSRGKKKNRSNLGLVPTIKKKKKNIYIYFLFFWNSVRLLSIPDLTTSREKRLDRL